MREPRASLATISICSWDAVYHVTCYEIVSSLRRPFASDLWKPPASNHSGIHRNLALAVGAIVCSPTGHHDAADRGPADQAGLSSPHINPVLELEKSFDALRIHIV